MKSMLTFDHSDIFVNIYITIIWEDILMTEIFKGDFLDDEKLSIRQWVNDNQPKISQNITIGENEYIIFIVLDEHKRITGFKAIKPNVKYNEIKLVNSKYIAYRFYDLQDGMRFIAFNTITRDFVFLEKLSAELLKCILDNDKLLLDAFCNANELSTDDVNEFCNQLRDFGFFQSKNQDIINKAVNPNVPISSDDSKYDPYLDDFKEILHHNGLFYSFHLDLTVLCNEKCVHCYHTFDKYDCSKELKTKEVLELIDKIYEIGVFSITISGGECLLRKDFIEILDYIATKHMLVSIFTNGTLLTDELVKQLLNYPINIVSVSLYGNNSELHDSITQVKGSFDKTLAGISVLKKYDINFELKCMVLEKNISQMEDIRYFLRELADGRECRVDTFLFSKMDGNTDNFAEQATRDSLFNLIRTDPEFYFTVSRARRRVNDFNESPCVAGRYNLYCDSYGNIYPCVSFRLLLCKYTELSNIKNNVILKEWLDTKVCDFSDCFKHDYCEFCTEQCAGRNLLENNDYLDSRNIVSCDKAKLILEWYNDTHSDNKI